MELYSLQSINERRQEFSHINYSSDAVKWGINNSRYCLGEKIRPGDHISHDKKIKGAMRVHWNEHWEVGCSHLLIMLITW